MKSGSLFNVYCDESCHIENDHIPVMAWGAVACEADFTRTVATEIRNLKVQHGLNPKFEAKWTKVSPAKVDFYCKLIDIFLQYPQLRFRGLLVPDKGILNHANFKQSHDDWYYKMYYHMLRPIFNGANSYRIYVDVKDTRGGPKTDKLHEVLCTKLHDYERQTIQRIQQIRSHESELMQITDILIGAMTYENRGLETNTAKLSVINMLKNRFGTPALSITSAFSATKFNILAWRPNER